MRQFEEEGLKALEKKEEREEDPRLLKRKNYHGHKILTE